jgi:hypothetical protein
MVLRNSESVPMNWIGAANQTVSKDQKVQKKRSRVARCFIFTPKRQILVHYWDGIFWCNLMDFWSLDWYISCSIDIFYTYPFGIFTAILVIFFPILVSCTQKNMATLRSIGLLSQNFVFENTS